jgi:hypothetical protein
MMLNEILTCIRIVHNSTMKARENYVKLNELDLSLFLITWNYKGSYLVEHQNNVKV